MFQKCQKYQTFFKSLQKLKMFFLKISSSLIVSHEQKREKSCISRAKTRKSFHICRKSIRTAPAQKKVFVSKKSFKKKFSFQKKSFKKKFSFQKKSFKKSFRFKKNQKKVTNDSKKSKKSFRFEKNQKKFSIQKK